MEKNKMIIVTLLVIIIALLAGILISMPNLGKTDATAETMNNTTTVNETTSTPVTSDTITVELPSFDTKYTKTVGEYTVEAEKWMGGSVGGFEVHLYKNGEPVYKDSYMTRA
ncbi:hypothetical protein, partial [Methanobrevibacter sp.]|uniref:hypothetical protein n=1 Tax=Methanobrevibacter sp. TaxID=66852 RepID=UPI0038673E3B